MKRYFNLILFYFINLVKYIFVLFAKIIFYYYKKPQKSITAFVFHEVTDTPSQFSIQYNLAVSVKTFETQIDFINRNYTIIHPFELENCDKLPKNAALITFDDGMLSSFENGLKILEKKNIPCLFFLNFGAIFHSQPLISSELSFLQKHSHDFCNILINKEGLTPPFYLSITPKIFEYYIDEFRYKFPKEVIQNYQGELATVEIVQKWGNNKNIIYANHLYQHWNSEALSDEEFIIELDQNARFLRNYPYSSNFFAFPNGQPKTCFSKRHLNILIDKKINKFFSSSGKINFNPEDKLIDRIGLTEKDFKDHLIFFRIFRVFINDFFKISS